VSNSVVDCMVNVYSQCWYKEVGKEYMAGIVRIVNISTGIV